MCHAPSPPARSAEHDALVVDIDRFFTAGIDSNTSISPAQCTGAVYAAETVELDLP